LAQFNGLGVVVAVSFHYDICTAGHATGVIDALRPQIPPMTTTSTSGLDRPEALISSRYKYDGQATTPLTTAQIAARDRFVAATSGGTLQFETVKECPLCRDTRQPVIARKDGYGIRVDTTCCPGCGLVYAADRLNGESIQRFYSEYYRDLYEADVGGTALMDRFAQARATSTRSTKKIVQSLGLSPVTDIIAEIGAGGGWNLVPFADLGFRTMGFDYDPRLLDLGRAQGIEMHDLNDAPASEKLPDNVALLLAHEVLEHVADPYTFLAELNGMVRPGGHLYLTVPPLPDIPFGYALGDPLREFQLAHLTLLDEETLSAFLAQAGFRITARRPDLRLIAQRVGEPVRQPALIPGNHRRNMRRLRISDRIARHAWPVMYAICGGRYASYMRVTKLFGAIISGSRRRALLERKTSAGV
jgi:2-polyprenyl-3-methyl-5-hydroxy-6-metoxy-1,4-benzoquinol methylase